MELLFEILGEIFFEGIFEIIKNKNISKWIRYPLFIFMNALYLVILGIFIISIKLFIKKEILGGVVMLFILFLLLILYICFFRKLLKK